MSIDWFTFTAQIVNFLILIILLKRFFYGPILKAIGDREAEIATRFKQADVRQSEAENAQRDFETRIEELTHTKQQLLADAASEVERWKSERLNEARSEVETSRAEWFAALDRERGQLRDDLLEQCQRDGLRLAEGVLKCLADKDVEQLMVSSFVRRLDSALSRPPSDAGDPITVRSAFELSETQKQELRTTFEDNGYNPNTIQFRVDESLICGIELRTRDHELFWNARESLDWLAAESARDLDQTLIIPDGLDREPEVSHAT